MPQLFFLFHFFLGRHSVSSEFPVQQNTLYTAIFKENILLHHGKKHNHPSSYCLKKCKF